MPSRDIYSVHTHRPQVRIIPVSHPTYSTRPSPGSTPPASSPVEDLPYVLQPDQLALKSAFSIVLLSLSPYFRVLDEPVEHDNLDHSATSPFIRLLREVFGVPPQHAVSTLKHHLSIINQAIVSSTDGLYIVVDPCPVLMAGGLGQGTATTPASHQTNPNAVLTPDMCQAILYLLAYYQELAKLCDIGVSPATIASAVLAKQSDPSGTWDASTVDWDLIAESCVAARHATQGPAGSCDVVLPLFPPRTNYQIYTIPTLINFASPTVIAVNSPSLTTDLEYLVSGSLPSTPGQHLLDFALPRVVCHIMRSIHFDSLVWNNQASSVNQASNTEAIDQCKAHPARPVSTLPLSIFAQGVNLKTSLPSSISNQLIQVAPVWEQHYSSDAALNLFIANTPQLRHWSPTPLELSTTTLPSLLPSPSTPSREGTGVAETVLLEIDCFALHDLIHNLASPADYAGISARGPNSTKAFRPFHIINPPPNWANTNTTRPCTAFSACCIGGSFDHLHTGHHSLLLTAMLLGSDQLILGITATAMLRKKAYRDQIEPWALRVAQVLSYCQLFKGQCGSAQAASPTHHTHALAAGPNESFVEHLKLLPRVPNDDPTAETGSLPSDTMTDLTTIPSFRLDLTSSSPICRSQESHHITTTVDSSPTPFTVIIEPLFDMYGPSVVYKEIECLVLSEEVRKGGPLVNAERERRGLPPSQLFVAPLLALPQAIPVPSESGPDSPQRFIPVSNTELKVSSTDFRHFFSLIAASNQESGASSPPLVSGSSP